MEDVEKRHHEHAQKEKWINGAEAGAVCLEFFLNEKQTACVVFVTEVK
jgi:hypothetical protein